MCLSEMTTWPPYEYSSVMSCMYFSQTQLWSPQLPLLMYNPLICVCFLLCYFYSVVLSIVYKVEQVKLLHAKVLLSLWDSVLMSWLSSLLGWVNFLETELSSVSDGDKLESSAAVFQVQCLEVVWAAVESTHQPSTLHWLSGVFNAVTGSQEFWENISHLKHYV